MQSDKETKPVWLRILEIPITVLCILLPLFLLYLYLMRPPEPLTIAIGYQGFEQQSVQTDERIVVFSNELLAVPVTLCIGKDQQCIMTPFTIQPMQSRHATDFLRGNEYSITIVTHLPYLRYANLDLTLNPYQPPAEDSYGE